MNERERVVAVSGGFDPVHVGHLKMFEAARALGDKLLVILNSDKFLMEKKGFVFMPFEERKEILEGIRFVDEVAECIDRDHTVCETLKWLRPKVFANGGDRDGTEKIPEVHVCRAYGIEMVFGVGGGKVQSSSALARSARNRRGWYV